MREGDKEMATPDLKTRLTDQVKARVPAYPPRSNPLLSTPSLAIVAYTMTRHDIIPVIINQTAVLEISPMREMHVCIDNSHLEEYT